MLPTKQVKKWNTDNERLKKDPKWKPSRPNFCPCIDPDTNKRCGKYMNAIWDQMFYEQYGYCESCFRKYNQHIPDIDKKVDELIGEE